MDHAKIADKYDNFGRRSYRSLSGCAPPDFLPHRAYDLFVFEPKGSEPILNGLLPPPREADPKRFFGRSPIPSLSFLWKTVTAAIFDVARCPSKEKAT